MRMYYDTGAFMLAFEHVMMADETEKIFSIRAIGRQVFVQLPWITSKSVLGEHLGTRTGLTRAQITNCC
jgi:hypothetical protein